MQWEIVKPHKPDHYSLLLVKYSSSDVKQKYICERFQESKDKKSLIVVDRDSNNILINDFTEGASFAKCTRIEEYHENRFIMKLSNLCGVFDEKGYALLPPKYDELNHTAASTFIFKRNDTVGILNNLFHEIYSIKANRIEYLDFGLYKVEFESHETINYSTVFKSEVIVINRYGDLIIQRFWGDICNFYGLCFKSIIKKWDSDGLNVHYYFGLIDNYGQTILDPIYEHISQYKDGVSVITTRNHIGHKIKGLINEKGEIICSPKYYGIGERFGNHLLVWVKTNYGAVKWNISFDGVGQNLMFGVINRNGKEILAPQFEKIVLFKNGSFVGFKNKRYCYYNNLGEVIPENQFDEIITGTRFYPFRLDDKWGFIDSFDGSIAAEPKYKKTFCAGSVVNSSEKYVLGIVETDIGKYFQFDFDQQIITDVECIPSWSLVRFGKNNFVPTEFDYTPLNLR